MHLYISSINIVLAMHEMFVSLLDYFNLTLKKHNSFFRTILLCFIIKNVNYWFGCMETGPESKCSVKG
jgi:hypothetical protein